jgi:acyl carrier protein
MPATVTPEAVQQTVVDALASFGPEPDQITRDATFEALDIDSLDLVELAQVVEEEYGVVLKGDDVKDIKTVGEAIDLVVARAGGTGASSSRESARSRRSASAHRR